MVVVADSRLYRVTPEATKSAPSGQSKSQNTPSFSPPRRTSSALPASRSRANRSSDQNIRRPAATCTPTMFHRHFLERTKCLVMVTMARATKGTTGLSSAQTRRPRTSWPRARRSQEKPSYSLSMRIRAATLFVIESMITTTEIVQGVQSSASSKPPPKTESPQPSPDGRSPPACSSQKLKRAKRRAMALMMMRCDHQSILQVNSHRDIDKFTHSNRIITQSTIKTHLFSYPCPSLFYVSN